MIKKEELTKEQIQFMKELEAEQDRLFKLYDFHHKIWMDLDQYYESQDIQNEATDVWVDDIPEKVITIVDIPTSINPTHCISDGHLIAIIRKRAKQLDVDLSGWKVLRSDGDLERRIY